MATRLTNMKIMEVSLVDNPANKSAKVVLMKRADGEIWWDIEEFTKREFSADARRSAASSGAAEPDGSFPIENATDLHNAMRAVGRSKNPGKTKAHIRARAKALGITSELSDAFKSADGLELREEDKALAAGEAAEAGDPGANDMELEMSEAIKKALGLSADAKEDDVIKAIADRELALDIAKSGMDDSEKEFHEGLKKEDDRKAFRDMSRDERGKCMKKSAPPLPEHVVKQLAEAEDLRKRLAVLEDERESSRYEKIAAGTGVAGLTGTLLRKAHAGDQTAVNELVKLAATAQNALDDVGVFKEFGTAQGAAGDEIDLLTAKAAELRKNHPHLSQEQAFAKVYEDPSSRDIVKAERRKNRPNAA